MSYEDSWAGNITITRHPWVLDFHVLSTSKKKLETVKTGVSLVFFRLSRRTAADTTGKAKRGALLISSSSFILFRFVFHSYYPRIFIYGLVVILQSSESSSSCALLTRCNDVLVLPFPWLEPWKRNWSLVIPDVHRSNVIVIRDWSDDSQIQGSLARTTSHTYTHETRLGFALLFIVLAWQWSSDSNEIN